MQNAHKHNWTRLQITKPFSALQQASNHTRVWQTSGCRFIVASPVDLDRIALASCLLQFCAGCLIWCSQHGKVLLHNDLCWINVRAMYSVSVIISVETFPDALFWGFDLQGRSPLGREDTFSTEHC